MSGPGLALRGADLTTTKAVNDVISELTRAQNKHPDFHSTHEGYAVILGELERLWEEIRALDPSSERMREEAKRVAAMGLRFMIDICGKDSP